MQTLKLVVHGSYYDSQIYSGRLYLWTNKGSIITIDWDNLVSSINVQDRLRLALVCAFQKSEYLYGDHWQLIFQDSEIKKVIQRKFSDLARKTLEFSEQQLRSYIVREQDNPFSFPHADSVIYQNTLYVGNQSGILYSSCDRKRRTPVSPNATKMWDGPVLGLAASYATLSVSAGSEGLFEYDLESNYGRYNSHDFQPLIKQHSNSARWMYASIFSSSYFNEGYLADYVNLRDNESDTSMRERKLREIVPSSEIFGHRTRNEATSYTWGVHDKICFANRGSIEVIQYSPYKEARERFTKLGSVKTNDLSGDIISGDSALFGYVLESENGLSVINSLTESEWFQGEPVNWRVFPRSKFYTNQLHVTYDDHLCIYSFNEDYFVDQKTKTVGIRHVKQFPARSSRSSFGHTDF